MSKINETNYPRRTQASYENTDMLVIQESGGNTYTTRIEDLREDCQETLAPTIDKINDALAPAENGATASQSYAIGEHFMRDGAFCTAIAAITSGGSFTLNTNYVVGTIADALSSLNSDLVDEEITSQCTFDSSIVIGGQWGGHVYKNKAQRVIYGNIHASGTLSNGILIVTLPSNIHSAIVGECGIASYNIQGTMTTGVYVTALGSNELKAFNNNNTYQMDSPAFMFRLPYTET